jgi:hypothetical protein
LVNDRVGKEHFDREAFTVDLGGASRAGLETLFDDLEAKTDLIDDALHFGIKSRFNNYLDAMSEFKAVEDSVISQIESITVIR